MATLCKNVYDNANRDAIVKLMEIHDHNRVQSRQILENCVFGKKILKKVTHNGHNQKSGLDKKTCQKCHFSIAMVFAIRK